MSNLLRDPAGPDAAPATTVPGSAADGAAIEVLTAREVPLGGTRKLRVRRTLPHRSLRTVGAWCFVDHYGPVPLAQEGMDVPPHPHVGLQTVTWLLEGEVLHQDSLGSEQVIAPGQLNLMTAGHGIAHAETSVPRPGGHLHGVQLWVALPDASRHQPAHFEHHADLPAWSGPGVEATVLMGELDGVRSPAATYTPLLGTELSLHGVAAVPLEPDFEHAVLALDGTVDVDGMLVQPGSLAHLGRGRRSLRLHADRPGRALLLGGEPFGEELLMWWNFVGRTHEDIARAREDWATGRRFGRVVGYSGEALLAPPLPSTRLRPRPSGSGRIA
ncbi:MAG TPA: pirin family protein [Motilibacteraceae bacterium]|nr:pirin family protein [Motilibacteraceae bacterium]